MNNFRNRWEITKNWQLIFPVLGSIALLYSSYKFAAIFTKNYHIAIFIIATILIYFLLLKFILFIFKKLENRWIVNQKWEMISIFLVFAITGSSSVFIGKPIIKFLGITEENLNITVYWFLYIIIGLIFYQILLVFFGWLFGQFKFFWEFEKKMLKRFGLKRFFN